MAGTVVADLFAKLGLLPDKKSFDKGDALIGKIKTALAAFVGIAGLHAIKGMVDDTVELGGHLDDLSKKTGISAEALQEWGFAAKLSGSDLDSVAAGISKFSRGLDEASRTGKGPAAEALARLGINANASSFKQLSLNDKVLEFADRLADVKDPAAKASIAVGAFGKSGADLIPMFSEGADGLKELTDQAKEFELTTKDVSALDQFGDDLDKTKMSLTGLKNQAIAQLIPVLQPMLDAFREWVRTNRELIATTIKSAVEGLIEVIKVLGTIMAGVAKVIQFFADHAEIAKSMLIGLGIAMGVFAVQAAVAWVTAAAGPLLIAAGITALVLGVRALIRNWDKVAPAIRGACNRAWQAIKDAGNRIKTFFVTDIPNAIMGAFEAAWNAIVAGAKKVGNTVRNLPVIKQFIDFGQGAGEAAAKAVKAIRGDDSGDASSVIAPVPSRSDLGASNAPVQIRGGDIKVEVNTAHGEPQAIADTVAAAINKHMDTWLLETEAVVG